MRWRGRSITMSVSTLADIDAESGRSSRGRVFAIGQGGRMAAYELTSGQRIWELNIAGISTPWVAGEWLFVLTDDAQAAVHHARHGQAALDFAAAALS